MATISPRTMMPIFNDFALAGSLDSAKGKVMWKAMTLMAAIAVNVFGQAASAELINRVAGWDIERLNDGGLSGCSMTMRFSGGVTLTFLQSSAKPEVTHILLSSPGWQSLTPGRPYPVEIAIGRAQFLETANSFESPHGRGLAIAIPKGNYFRIYDGMAGAFRVSSEGKQLIGYSPAGADINAVAETSRCLKSFADPFSG